jgi:nucleotide-binding universal stress UspA family protein
MDLNTFLVATDFSEGAGAAFQMAKKLAKSLGAKLVLLHVINQKLVVRLAEYLQAEPDSFLPDLREKAQKQMSAFLDRWQTDGLECESMVSVGLPFQEIAIIARDLAVDLVALGGYGRTSGARPLEDLFFGSTAEKVVRLLPCPVLCVPLDKDQEND